MKTHLLVPKGEKPGMCDSISKGPCLPFAMFQEDFIRKVKAYASPPLSTARRGEGASSEPTLYLPPGEGRGTTKPRPPISRAVVYR